MRFLTWSLRLALFLLLLGFAVKNDQAVVLRYFFGLEWQTSLVVALLCFFAAGVVIGVLAMLGSLLRQRHELASVRRELHANRTLAEQDALIQAQTTPPEILT
jgi:uncharacterized integral membrane protein